MKSIVTISSVSESVRASGEGIAAHAFSVTNITAARLGVGARVIVEAPAEDDWFTVEGAGGELASNETGQIIVTARLPADTKPGKYKFKLQVYSTERGRAGEDFVNGPTAVVEMPEKEIVPNGTGGGGDKKWVWIAVAAAVVLLSGGLGGWLLWPSGGVTVPEVAHKMMIDEARKALQAVGLRNVKEEPMQTSDAAPDSVVKQEPKGGTRVTTGTLVTLWVARSAGPVTTAVPNVVRLPLDVAEQQLEAAGLKAVKKGPLVATLEFKAGVVTKQRPAAFSQVPPGAAVVLSVAGESVKIPTVKGNRLQDALRKMTAARLLVKVTGDQDKLNQRVVSTTPPEGQAVLAGSQVTIHMPGHITWIPLSKFPAQIRKELKTTRGIK
jgi:beta-lactam-binding protein with PASTA domain